MNDPAPAGPLGLLFSGGLDSGILLGHLVNQRHRVQPIYIRSGLTWEPEELAAARRFAAALQSDLAAQIVVLEMPLADLYHDHWSITGRRTPDASSHDDAVYLPGRNPLLLVKAAVWCHLNGLTRIALAPLKTNPFADATDEFFGEFQTALNRALSATLEILRPFAQLDKRQVMELGRELPLGETFSCIAPVGGLHCGACNKCAERQQAFRVAGMKDPTRYAAAKLAWT